MAEVEPGLYRHYKGGLYTVLTTAFFEPTMALMVVYSNSEGVTYVRDAAEFSGEVMYGPQGLIYRFEKMPPHADCPECGGTGEITDKRYTIAGRGCDCWKVHPTVEGVK